MKNPIRHSKNTRSAAALLGIVTLAASPLPSAWRNWRYSRAIELPPTGATRLAGIVVAPDIYGRSDLRAPLIDLRVIDEQGAAAPFVLFWHRGERSTSRLPSTLHEQSFTPGLYTQLVTEIVSKAPFHNAVQLLTNNSDFMEWVRVEASDDAHTWRIVQGRAPIFRFQSEGREGTQAVHYSENNARFLRVSILDGEKRFTVLGVQVLYDTSVAAEHTRMGSPLGADINSPAGKSVWTIDSGDSHFPASEVRFGVSPPSEFSRAVEVQVSDDKEEWRPLTEGEIYRFGQGAAEQEQLGIAIPSGMTPARFCRVTIENRSDSPLPNVTAQFYTTPEHVVFEQQPGRTYRLIYGRPEATRATYDLERRVNENQRAQAVVGTLGPEEVNRDWSDPRPWTEKYDFALWIALAIAVFLIGLTAIRSLRRSASPAGN